jgi:putative ABC transport system permease protein
MIRQTFTELLKNKSRSLLTVAGITIGIAVVIVVLSAGNGVKGLILGELDSFGDNWIQIEPKIPSTGQFSNDNADAQARGAVVTTLKHEDMEAILRLDNVTNAYAAITSQAVISYENEKKQPTIFGVTASYNEIDKGKLEAGRFFDRDDEIGAAQVIVLGYDIAKTFFGDSEAVGKNVSVGGKQYRVVGVMEKRGSMAFFDYDALVYIPLTTVQKKIAGINHVLFVTAQMERGTNGEALAEEIRAVLRERHDITDPNKDDFAVTTQAQSVELINGVFFGISTLLVVLAGISLVVGGVGIMNVMYVSVVERTFEIGLRKAVGAKPKDIRKQFLFEAIALTSVGGFFGVIAGVVISLLISIVANTLGFNWDFIISIPSIILATVFSIAVGVGFGYFPAKKASTLEVVEALRAE